MELFTSTSAKKEKEVKTAFILTLRKLSGYPVRAADLDVEFVCGETEFIDVKFAVQAGKDAFCLIDLLYNDPARFLESFSADFSEELFKYLLFNNRISYLPFYLNRYRNVRINISEQVFAGTFSFDFMIRK